MSRKQVDFEYRIARVSAVDAGASKDVLADFVRSYLLSGWELIRSETVHYQGNDSFVALHFVKYEEVSDLEPVLDGVRKRASAS